MRTLDSTNVLADEICLFFFRWKGIFLKINHHDPVRFVKSINRMKGNDYQVVATKNGKYLGYVSKDSILGVDGRDYTLYIFLPEDRSIVIDKLIKSGVYAE